MNWQAAAVIFAAGTFYAGVRLLRRDVTGVRKVVNTNERGRKHFNKKLLGILRVALPPEHSEKVIQLLEEDDE
jgi:hypothetical protein